MSEPFPQAFNDAGLDVIHCQTFHMILSLMPHISFPYSSLEEQLIPTKLLIPGYINY